MEKELVSIIMPCHNGEKYLIDAIESVLNQTYRNWELLIIDDNSVDSSFQIAKEFEKKDIRIKVFKTEKSLGLPACPRNIGIKKSKGRYIAFLDSDDILMPTKLEKQLPFFSLKDVGVVYSNVIKMNSNGKLLNKFVVAPTFIDYVSLLDGCSITSPAAIYDTEKVGRVLQKEIHHEDYLMWLEILKKNVIAINTGSFEYIYRVQKTSTSGNKLKTFKWHWSILRYEIKLPYIVAIKHFLRYVFKGIKKYFS